MKPFKSSTLPDLCSWQRGPFALCYLAILLLLISFPLWKGLDEAVFTFTSRALKLHPYLAAFWALANHHLADWVEDLCILAFYALSILKTPKIERKKRGFQLIFSVLFTAPIILLINRFLCRILIRLRRDSPTLAMQGTTLLSELVPWLEIKDVSSKSFPGDHATTALLFATTYAFYAGKRLGFYAFLYAGFLCLPRLIAGAHWFSDLIIGSGSIALFAISWLLFTPLGTKGPAWLQKMMSLSVDSRR